MDNAKLERFANSLLEAKRSIKECTVCHNLATSDLCSVCASAERDRSVICVVEDVKALKKLNLYGAIIGKAYYIGAIDLSEALEVAR